MQELLFITGNNGKRHAAIQAGSKYDIRVLAPSLPINVPEIQHHSVVEVAKHSAILAVLYTCQPFFLHDGGCFCHGLGEFPGTNTRPVLEQIGLKGFLRLLDGCDRRVTMRNAVAYHSRDRWEQGEEPVIFTDDVPGYMVSEPQGPEDDPFSWSSLFRLFVPKGLEKALACYNQEEVRLWREGRDPPSAYHQLFAWLTCPK